MNPVEFNDIEPLQEYYKDCNGHFYCVSRIIDAAKDLPEFEIPLCCLDLSIEIWSGCDMFALAYHCKKVKEADLDFPIILDWRGAVADGRHRIMKALVNGETTIKAKRLVYRMTPCKEAP